MMKKTVLYLSILIVASDLYAQVPAWSVNPSDYSNSMVVVGVIKVDGVESVDENDLVAAFIDDEVRGVTNVKYESVADRYIAYLIVYGNESGKEVTFKIYDADADLQLDAHRTASFSINGIIGNIASPFLFTNSALNAHAQMLSFSFPQSNGESVIGSDTISVPLVEGTNPSSLTADFTSSEGSTVKVGEVIQVSGATANDFSDPVTYSVISEDGETTSVYTVIVDVTDNPPTGILLSSDRVLENNEVDKVVGSLSTVDDGIEHSYALVSGPGDQDNDHFSIVDGQLIAKTSFNFENKDVYLVRLQVADHKSQIYEEIFEIHVEDVNEAPTLINPVGVINKEADTNLSFFMSNVFMDEDANDELTLSIHVPGSSSLPAGVSFESNAWLTLNGDLTLNEFEVVLTATDLDGLLARDTVLVISEVESALGVDPSDKGFMIWPNPANEFISLKSDKNGHLKINKLIIRDLNAKSLQERVSWTNNTINISQLERGVYLLEVEIDGEPLYLKFIKQ